MAGSANSLPLALGMFRPGARVAVAVSGGADSVALLRALHSAAADQGLVLRVAHVHHGLRGEEADADAAFVRELAAQLGLPIDEQHVDTASRVSETGESVEQAARTLRYGFFRGLMEAGKVEVVATAHTLDDQAETVMLKWLRGAWTEGLGGISPVVEMAAGRIVRPMLQIRREEVEAYLRGIGQPWRDDSSNASADFTRNRVRHELLPLMRTFNPGIAVQLSRVADMAREEENYWQAELQRLLPGLLLPGKPVRGGGRSVATGGEEQQIAMDAGRLAALPVAVQRRVLRAAALRLGFRLEFDPLSRVLALLSERAGSRATVADGLLAERTPRELRLSRAASRSASSARAPVEIRVPGTTVAPEYGIQVETKEAPAPDTDGAIVTTVLLLRSWKPGDRVRLRHSLSEAKVKEVLQRLQASPQEKADWPVLVWQGKVLWMRGCEVQAPPGAPEAHVSELAGMAD
jgi:tRNA(Ile)-lysidine synthase